MAKSIAATEKIEYRFQILKLLQENKNGLSLKEISSMLSCSFKTAQRCTTVLLDQNEIERKARRSGGGRPYYLYFDLLLGH